jgi:hypothetical protein
VSAAMPNGRRSAFSVGITIESRRDSTALIRSAELELGGRETPRTAQKEVHDDHDR